jgi:hypothetical protein
VRRNGAVQAKKKSRSLHYAAGARARERKKKTGRFGRDDRLGVRRRMNRREKQAKRDPSTARPDVQTTHGEKASGRCAQDDTEGEEPAWEGGLYNSVEREGSASPRSAEQAP